MTPPSLQRYLYAYADPLLYVDLTGYAVYQVQKGDTLRGIATRNNVRPEDLITANRINGSVADPDKIYTGQRIWIPEVRQAGEQAITKDP
jgi:LysM repeat protein